MKICSALAALVVLGAPTNAFHAPAYQSARRPVSVRSTSAVQPNNKQIISAFAPGQKSSTSLSSSTTSSEDPYASPQLDTDALAKYAASAVTELTLFSATFQLLDMALAQFDTQLPFPAMAFIFYACSLKSRVFNPLVSDIYLNKQYRMQWWC